MGLRATCFRFRGCLMHGPETHSSYPVAVRAHVCHLLGTESSWLGAAAWQKQQGRDGHETLVLKTWGSGHLGAGLPPLLSPCHRCLYTSFCPLVVQMWLGGSGPRGRLLAHSEPYVSLPLGPGWVSCVILGLRVSSGGPTSSLISIKQ